MVLSKCNCFFGPGFSLIKTFLALRVFRLIISPNPVELDALKKWRARIYIDGTRVNLGRFYTKREAVEARKAAEGVKFGNE